MHAIDKRGSRLRRDTDAISEFCSFHRMPPHVRRRLGRYLQLKNRVDMTRDVLRSVLDPLPLLAQQTLLEQLYGPMVRKVPLFSGCGSAIVRAIVTRLSQVVV